ncbi:MAG TPA: DUF5317 domain-containing protein [Leptolinea sp.]
MAVALGLAATLLRARLTHRTLKLIGLRWEWLVFVAAIPQVLAFQIPFIGQWIPESIIPIIQVLTMFGLLVFAVINIVAPGFWALGFGLLCNFLVIVFNGGWMPISVETLKRMSPFRPEDYWVIGSRLGFTKDRILAPMDITLIWLSDRYTLPSWLPQNIAFSLGDIFISIGAVFLLWSLSRNFEKEKK